MPKIKHKKELIKISSHHLNTEELKRLGVAVGVALAFIHPSEFLPLMVSNAYDEFDGNNIYVVHTVRA